MKKLYSEIKTTAKHIAVLAVFGLSILGAGVVQDKAHWGSQANAAESVSRDFRHTETSSEQAVHVLSVPSKESMQVKELDECYKELDGLRGIGEAPKVKG